MLATDIWCLSYLHDPCLGTSMTTKLTDAQPSSKFHPCFNPESTSTGLRPRTKQSGLMINLLLVHSVLKDLLQNIS